MRGWKERHCEVGPGRRTPIEGLFASMEGGEVEVNKPRVVEIP
jgi:hypothetical protein